MGDFNKVISFILGLVVVVVFIAILSGRLNLGNRIPTLSGVTGVTTTPTPTEIIFPTSTITPTRSYTQPTPVMKVTRYPTKPVIGKTPGTIPNTGAPTLLIPLVISALFGGSLLKRSGKK